MKTILTFKDPDFDEPVEPQDRPKNYEKILDKFLDYRGYLAVEIDFEKGTARVVPVSE